MQEKSTDDLKQELMEQANLDQYITENEAYFVETDLTEVLTELYEKCGLSKAELARRAVMSEVYLYQVFSGRRRPSRDRLLCLCLALEATMDEIQALLQCASYAQLYPKIRRDAIIIHGIVHHTDLSAINDKLFAEGEKTLF